MRDTVTDGSLVPYEQAGSHHRQDSSRAGNQKHRRTEEVLQGDNVVLRHLFDTLPVELIAEILLNTNSPRDVLAVARCNKSLCKTLVHPTSNYIWKSVRKAYSLPPPEPISIFTEASYAAFLFGGGDCEICGKHTEALYTSFGTRIRLCQNKRCKKEFFNKGDHTRLDEILPHDEKIRQCLTYVEDNMQLLPDQNSISRRFRPYLSRRVYRESDAAREAIRCVLDPNGYLEKNKKKTTFIEKYMEFCVLLHDWKRLWKDLYIKTRITNEIFSKQLAQKNGWIHWELLTSTPYGSMQRLKNSRLERVTQKDYDNIAAEVKRTFVHLAMLRERKARETAYVNNRYAVEQHHQRLRSQQPRTVLPSLDVFRHLPIVQLLQGTSPGAIEFPPKDPPHDVYTTLLKESWVVERLKTELRQWREKARKDLAAVLGYSDWTALNANTNLEVMHPVDRVTARFLCKTCSKVASRYREDDCLDFAGACAHLCPGKKDKRVCGVWTAERFIKDEKAIEMLENLLTLCAIEASAHEAATTLETLGTTIQCTTCGPGIVMDFRSLVGHSHRHDKMTIRLISKEEVDNILLHPPQPSIVRSVTGSQPRLKAVRLQPNFGCRHCPNSVRHSLAVIETRPHWPQLTSVEESLGKPNLILPAVTSTNSRSKTEKVEKQFSFPGITSHLKEKHGILNIRDEDIFSFNPIDLPSEKKK